VARLEAPPTSAGPADRASSLEARLALTEFLIACEDLGELARQPLAWLRENSGVAAALCLVVESRASRLVVAGAAGVSEPGVGLTQVDLEDRDHPLSAVFFGRRPQTLTASDRLPALGESFDRIGAVPLYGLMGQEDVPVGVLLLAPPTNESMRDARWLADLLGQRLVRALRLRLQTESERELHRERMLLDAVPDPLLLTDTEGRMLIANSRAQALLAPRDGESEGRRRAVALNNMFFSSALARTALEEGGTSRRELVLVDPEEGSDLLFELINTVVRDAREGTAVASILRNVGDLRQAIEQIEDNLRKLRGAEASVRAERDRLDLVLDSVADPILVTDPAGALVMMNPPAERLFTARPEAGPEEETRVSANDAHFSSFISNLFITETGARRHGNLGLIDPQTGQALPVEAIAGTVLSEHDEIAGVVTILHDRREALEKTRLYEKLQQFSSQLEEKVREATGELLHRNELLNRQRLALEEASGLKTQFLANMSHELRTPLNAIFGYSSMLIEGVYGPLNAAQLNSLQRLSSNARHLLELINDVLDISRIEAGKMPLHLATFEPGALVDEVLAEVEPLIARSGLEVRSQLGRLPPRFHSDRAKLKQIVLNLVTNAIKFTQRGSVTVKAAIGEGRLSIAVTDTGIGIAEADLERVFEDFRQLDSSLARGHGGAGLGLTISRRLARMLGGEITLQSQPGRGSTFTLVLPQRRRRA
jgi:signal transduction histidine kinase/PAS domain-containing protein